MEDDEWECARCTLCNVGSESCCAACGAARGAASASEASDSDSDGGGSDGDYDMATGMDGPDEAAHTVEVHVAKRRWEETEAKRIKARDAEAARSGTVASISFDEKKAAQAQIFTSQARPSPSLLRLPLRRSALPPSAGPNPGSDERALRLLRPRRAGVLPHAERGAVQDQERASGASERVR
jgi:hypothetical protein